MQINLKSVPYFQEADFDHCVQSGECSIENFQLTYFCGSAEKCKKGGDPEAIQRAKYNAETFYSIVGLTDDLKRTFDLLEAYLPKFFIGAPALLKKYANLKLNENKHKAIQNDTIGLLMDNPAIQGELEFYDFIRQRFELQYQAIASLISPGTAQKKTTRRSFQTI
jgi:hypothetical protein